MSDADMAWYLDRMRNMWRRGWNPIVLRGDPQGGKAPVTRGWPEYAITGMSEDDLERQEAAAYAYVRRHDSMPLLGSVCSKDFLWVDIDVEDRELSDILVDICVDEWGDTPMVRRSYGGRVLLGYRCKGAGSAKLHPVEFYFGSGQVAVYGKHPKRDCSYTWADMDRGAPWTIAPDDSHIPRIKSLAHLRAVAATISAGGAGTQPGKIMASPKFAKLGNGGQWAPRVKSNLDVTETSLWRAMRAAYGSAMTRGRTRDTNIVFVKCPNTDHDPGNKSSTAIIADKDGTAHIACQHSTCEGMTTADYLNLMFDVVMTRRDHNTVTLWNDALGFWHRNVDDRMERAYARLEEIVKDD